MFNSNTQKNVSIPPRPYIPIVGMNEPLAHLQTWSKVARSEKYVPTFYYGAKKGT